MSTEELSADVNPHKILRTLWAHAQCDESELDGISLTGHDPVLPSSFPLGAFAGATVAAAAGAAAQLHQQRSGVKQRIRVALRDAGAAFRSERYVLVDGKAPPSPWGPLSGYYQTGDDKFVQIHANFPHHHAGIATLLECEDQRDAVSRALKDWSGQAFEDAAAEQGLCVGLLRDRHAWEAHPQGRAVAGLKLFEIEKLDDSPPEPMAAHARPLGDVRVLDLTRVIAGPVCGRTMASHGAQVLRVGAPHLPLVPNLWLDVARGKRSCHLDLSHAPDSARLGELVKQCDVFVQAYRPGALSERGWGPEAVCAQRPGAIYVTLSAYGHEGPWANRRGFDSLVQTVSGIGAEGARIRGQAGSSPLPCQALDHASGYIAAFGAMVALRRRACEGGSWRVRVSLAQTAHWLWTLGRLPSPSVPDMSIEDIADRMETTPSTHGAISAIRPAEWLEKTPAQWARPAAALGDDPPRWWEGV
jgi:crotonobetainyl-CoA:carnitine CoA-transferase CaiB-like acyl-CoA transferase